LIIDENKGFIDNLKELIEMSFRQMDSMTVVSFDNFKRNINVCPDIIASSKEGAWDIKSQDLRVLSFKLSTLRQIEIYSGFKPLEREDIVEIITKHIRAIQVFNNPKNQS
jgi:hypothetical protein